MKTTRLLAVLATSALVATAVACGSPDSSTESVGEQKEAICVDYPCTRLPSTTDRYRVSSGFVAVDDPGTTFNCSGHPDGYPDGYRYMFTDDGKCAIFKPDATACYDGGVAGDAGRICYGFTMVSYYTCPVNHPNMSCNAYTGACSCY